MVASRVSGFQIAISVPRLTQSLLLLGQGAFAPYTATESFMTVRTLGLLALLAFADPTRAAIVSLTPPSPPVAPPAAPNLGGVLPILDPAPLPLVDTTVGPKVGDVPPSADAPINPITPPDGVAAMSIEPPPVAPPSSNVSAPDPNPVPGPVGVVGLLITAGVFGVRKLIRRKATEEVVAEAE